MHKLKPTDDWVGAHESSGLCGMAIGSLCMITPLVWIKSAHFVHPTTKTLTQKSQSTSTQFNSVTEGRCPLSSSLSSPNWVAWVLWVHHEFPWIPRWAPRWVPLSSPWVPLSSSLSPTPGEICVIFVMFFARNFFYIILYLICELFEIAFLSPSTWVPWVPNLAFPLSSPGCLPSVQSRITKVRRRHCARRFRVALSGRRRLI